MQYGSAQISTMEILSPQWSLSENFRTFKKVMCLAAGYPPSPTNDLGCHRVGLRFLVACRSLFDPAAAGRALIPCRLLQNYDVHFIPRQLAARWLIAVRNSDMPCVLLTAIIAIPCKNPCIILDIYQTHDVYFRALKHRSNVEKQPVIYC